MPPAATAVMARCTASADAPCLISSRPAIWERPGPAGPCMVTRVCIHKCIRNRKLVLTSIFLDLGFGPRDGYWLLPARCCCRWPGCSAGWAGFPLERDLARLQARAPEGWPHFAARPSQLTLPRPARSIGCGESLSRRQPVGVRVCCQDRRPAWAGALRAPLKTQRKYGQGPNDPTILRAYSSVVVRASERRLRGRLEAGASRAGGRWPRFP